MAAPPEPQELPLSGVYSCVGRKTEIHLKELRKGLEPGSDPVYVESPKHDRHVAKKEQPTQVVVQQKGPMADVERTLLERLGNKGNKEPVVAKEEPAKVVALQKSRSVPHQSPAFTSQSFDQAALNETARRTLHRHFVESKLEEKPTLGRYRVVHAMVEERSPDWDFRLRDPHVTRREKADAAKEAMLAELRSAPREPKPAPVAKPRKYQLSVGTERPDVRMDAGRNFMHLLTFHEGTVQDHADCDTKFDQDLNQSTVPRQPEWDFAKVLDRKGPVQRTHFEPGKYPVNYKQVEPTMKTFVPFGTNIGRSASLGHLAASGAQKLGDQKPDRSLHRLAPCQSQIPRTDMNIQKMEKDLPRPPLSKKTKPLYNEHDPEVVARVEKFEKNFDIGVAERFVKTKSDYTPNMDKTLRRDRNGNGHRCFQTDLNMRRARGFMLPETVGEVAGAVEDTKEKPERPRPDIGRTFMQMKARGKTKAHAEISPLRKHRQALCPTFSRSSPCSGFEPRITGGGSPSSGSREKQRPSSALTIIARPAAIMSSAELMGSSPSGPLRPYAALPEWEECLRLDREDTGEESLWTTGVTEMPAALGCSL